jgi:8-oxo-dGTP pyrophosphatase MutT (NUDIX family)
MMPDITWDMGTWTYSCRAAGVLLQGHRVLFQRLRGDAKWALPGGRVQLGELSSEAVVREFEEEIALTVRVARPLWIAEMIFDLHGRRRHQTCCYFLVTHPDVESIVATDSRLEFKWFDIASLHADRIAPTFLVDGLRSLPQEAQYIALRS